MSIHPTGWIRNATLGSARGSARMDRQYSIRRDFADIFPFLGAIRAQADTEREALGFFPEAAYEEAARQRKLIVLLSKEKDKSSYAGHLLFGGIFPILRIQQISIAKQHRRHGHATTLLRALIAQGEKESYLNIIANVATDLAAANLFYEKNGFVSTRLKVGGTSRGRKINVRILQLETPSLVSFMTGANKHKTPELLQQRNRSPDTPICAIDLNVFFDAIRKRARSEDAGAVFEAALRHQIRIAASQEFVSELERTSNDPSSDPILSLAKRIPNLPVQDKPIIKALTPIIAEIVFPERTAKRRLTPSDESDILHLAHVVAAGASGYITSDSKVLSARDSMMAQFNLDVIGLSEFVDLLDLPFNNTQGPSVRKTQNFRIHTPSAEEVTKFLGSERAAPDSFVDNGSISHCERRCVSDGDGIIGVGLLMPAAGLDKPSHTIVYVKQEHPFSSTVDDFLISEQIRCCSQTSACHLLMTDIPSHPIT